MQNASVETAEAITAVERHITPWIEVDWNGSGDRGGQPLGILNEWIVNARVERNLKGSAPEEITLIEGAAAAELTITVEGEWEGLPLAAAFSPYNGNSPFYGLDVEGADVHAWWDVWHSYGGFGDFISFRGYVRSADVDRETGRVIIHCLDRTELLRVPVNLVPWAVAQEQYRQGLVRAQLCDSQSVIDMALRQCDVSPTDVRPTKKYELGVPEDGLDGVHFWLAGTGSHVPILGWMDNANAQSFPDTEGGEPEMFTFAGPRHRLLDDSEPRPLALNSLADAGVSGGSNGVTNKFWVKDRDLFGTEGTFYLRAVLNQGGSFPDYYENANTTILRVNIGDTREVALRVASGQAYTEYRNTTPDPDDLFESERIDIPDGQANTEIWAQWDNTSGSGTRVQFRVGDTDTGWVSVGPAYSSSGNDDDLKGLVEVNHRVSLSDVAFASRNLTGAASNETFNVYKQAGRAAALDAGRNRMTFTPPRRGVDAWDLIEEVANAEFGSVFWDENGTFRFWNYDTIIAKRSSPVRDFTIDDTSTLGLSRSLDSVRNVWSVETSKRASARGLAYESNSVNEFLTPANTTEIHRVWVEDVQMVNPFELDQYDTTGGTNFPAWNDDVISGFVPQWYINGQWQEDDTRAASAPTCWFDVEGYLVVRVPNGWDEPIRFATNSGRPAFRVDGTKIVENGTLVNVQRYQDSIDKYGERNIRLSGDWYQDAFQSVNMLDSIAVNSTSPIPKSEKITIPADPRLQLGDAIRLRDSDGLGETLEAQIFGYALEWSADAPFIGEYTVEITQASGAGVWNSEQYGTWDDTFVWG